ncbi:hypothetical protein RMSM_01088 [Rhodopirellula maiorica SM1]|uniref:Uncharacterized protein n=1 Tax=Rhodopirellula maiorica SM1 TaxID=1265738 RepID=M5RRR8_9BACT|nr:hypothetical protein RMSM_01088 [Rhodopirellula maiorica SM1]
MRSTNSEGRRPHLNEIAAENAAWKPAVVANPKRPVGSNHRRRPHFCQKSNGNFGKKIFLQTLAAMIVNRHDRAF